MRVFQRGAVTKHVVVGLSASVLLWLSPGTCHAAESLPAKISAEAFWKVVTDLSEPDSYFATGENYPFVRDLEKQNPIIPLGGDFAGPKTIRSVGQYIREHDSFVSAFYFSNVVATCGIFRSSRR